MDKTRSPAQDALLNEVAKRVRTAIDKRAELLAEHLEKYDEALEHGDEDAIQAAGLILVLFSSGLIDPVAAEIKRWQEVDGMLARAEATHTP